MNSAAVNLFLHTSSSELFCISYRIKYENEYRLVTLNARRYIRTRICMYSRKAKRTTFVKQ